MKRLFRRNKKVKGGGGKKDGGNGGGNGTKNEEGRLLVPPSPVSPLTPSPVSAQQKQQLLQQQQQQQMQMLQQQKQQQQQQPMTPVPKQQPGGGGAVAAKEGGGGLHAGAEGSGRSGSIPPPQSSSDHSTFTGVYTTGGDMTLEPHLPPNMQKQQKHRHELPPESMRGDAPEFYDENQQPMHQQQQQNVATTTQVSNQNGRKVTTTTVHIPAAGPGSGNISSNNTDPAESSPDNGGGTGGSGGTSVAEIKKQQQMVIEQKKRQHQQQQMGQMSEFEAFTAQAVTTDLTRNLIKKFIADIWNRGEIDLIPLVCSSSLRFNGNTGFDRVGHDGLARMVITIRDALDDYHCEIHSMVVENNKAFCRLRFTGKHTGKLLGYDPTYKTVAWMGATEFTCQNGKILKVWELGDVKSLEEQLQQHQQAAPPQSMPTDGHLPGGE